MVFPILFQTAIANLSVFDSEGKIKSNTINVVDKDGQMIFSSGKLRGLIESYGYEKSISNDDGTQSTVEAGIYPDMLANFDKLAYSFANIFNKVHSLGHNLEGKPWFEANFFFLQMVQRLILQIKNSYKGAAKAILLGNLTPNDIAASTEVTSSADGVIVAGDGKNALNLANVASFLLSNKNQELEGNSTIDLTEFSIIENGTINSFYEGMIGKLGVDALQANRMTSNSQILSQTVENNRQSVSSVSLDEEMTNIIKFQHAYNAAARQITVVDEMLDKIINGMGTAGR